MIRSMTGFGRTADRQKKGGWAVEIRSLNHRYFEFSLKVPASLYGIEDRIREVCQGQVKRGKLTVAISESENSAPEELHLDEKVLRFYLSAIRKAQRQFKLSGKLSVGDLLTLPRIFSLDKKAEAPEKLWRSLRPLLEKALERLVQSRIQEGKVLCKDLLGRIGTIENRLTHIEARAKKRPQEYYERLKGRIQELFQQENTDHERIWREAAFLAEKADTTEEIVRLKSHFRLFREKVNSQGEVGRELDFLLQEMNRETNTLSSKGQDFGISKEGVFIKAELEKIREQIQNIE